MLRTGVINAAIKKKGGKKGKKRSMMPLQEVTLHKSKTQ